jgi:hypothetical protein
VSSLVLNGLSIPVAVQGADSSPNVIEDAARTVGGTMVRSRRAVVQSFKGNTIPVSAALAADIVGILNAQMDHWSFDNSTYWAWSEGGLTTDGGTGAYATTTPSPKFGAGYLEVNAGAYWSAATALGTAWTVMLWTYESGAWHHYALTSTGIRYKDGVVYGSAIAFLSVVSGSTRIGDTGAGAAQQFDDFLALQWVASADLVAGVYALGVAVAAPSPYASGDLVNGWAGQVTCEPPQVQYVPHMGSTFEQYGVTIQIQISQVAPS